MPIPTLFAAVAATWVAFLVGTYVASKRAGSGDLRTDLGMRVRPIDVIGLPIGVLAQLVLVPLVYLPLRGVWPDTFTDSKLSETADKLADRASGGSMVLLVLMVCVGAPIVEEIVYRGLLQRSFSARTSQVVAWLIVAAWFALDPLPADRVPGPVRLRARHRRLPDAHRSARHVVGDAHRLQRHRAAAGPAMSRVV